MKTIFTKDGYVAEVKLLDVISNSAGASYLLEVVKIEQISWWGGYPEGKRFTAWRSNLLKTNVWKLNLISDNGSQKGADNEDEEVKRRRGIKHQQTSYLT